MRHLFLVPLIVLLLGQTVPAAEPVPVFVSIPPQKYFAEKIGGDAVTVSVMVPPNGNPHTYEPTPRQMTALARAKAYFAVGVPFEESWLHRIASANPGLAVFHTEEKIHRLPMTGHHHHEAEDHGHHHEEHADPHIWLSPPLVKQQADAILAGLIQVDPERSSVYTENHARFVREIDALDARIKALLGTGDGKERRFMVFHPSWGYFASHYGLIQVPVEVAGKTPSPAELRHLIQEAREHGIKVVFVQPQFPSHSAQTIAEAIGGKVAVADPLADDWAENLLKLAQDLSAVLR